MLIETSGSFLALVLLSIFTDYPGTSYRPCGLHPFASLFHNSGRSNLASRSRRRNIEGYLGNPFSYHGGQMGSGAGTYGYHTWAKSKWYGVRMIITIP